MCPTQIPKRHTYFTRETERTPRLALTKRPAAPTSGATNLESAQTIECGRRVHVYHEHAQWHWSAAAHTVTHKICSHNTVLHGAQAELDDVRRGRRKVDRLESSWPYNGRTACTPNEIGDA